MFGQGLLKKGVLPAGGNPRSPSSQREGGGAARGPPDLDGTHSEVLAGRTSGKDHSFDSMPGPRHGPDAQGQARQPNALAIGGGGCTAMPPVWM